MNMKTLLLFFIAILIDISAAAQLPKVKANIGKASAKTSGNNLIVSTGKVDRIWRWTGKGLVTTALNNEETGKSWCDLKPALSSDWVFYGFLEGVKGKITNLEARESDDEGFTSKHLEVSVEVEYPTVGAAVQYRIWAYPDAPGIRTQVWVKGKKDLEMASKPVRFQDGFANIALLEGKNSFPYDAKIFEMPWYASVTRGEENV